jgi:hypothetical protein
MKPSCNKYGRTHKLTAKINRREFLKCSGAAGGVLLFGLQGEGVMANQKSRVAIDAVGLAILKSLGSNTQIMHTKIFEQEQIARAVEIGLGATSPSEIEVVAANAESREYRDCVTQILNQG